MDTNQQQFGMDQQQFGMDQQQYGMNQQQYGMNQQGLQLNQQGYDTNQPPMNLPLIDPMQGYDQITPEMNEKIVKSFKKLVMHDITPMMIQRAMLQPGEPGQPHPLMGLEKTSDQINTTKPEKCKCVHCHQTMVTRTENTVSGSQLGASIFLCCWCVLCMDDCADVQHYCSKCDAKLVNKERIQGKYDHVHQNKAYNF